MGRFSLFDKIRLYLCTEIGSYVDFPLPFQKSMVYKETE